MLIALSPAHADNHQEAPTIEEVLASNARAADAVRDTYRNPAETLAFFQVEPTMNVVEYGPGGGWYTRVLQPWISPVGRYLALQSDTGAPEPGEPSWVERFTRRAATEWSLEAGSITAFESDEIPDELVGSADRVLIFRSLHGMMGDNVADRELRAIRSLLADDGMVGVVQHRAPADAPYSYTDGSMGYLRQSDVVALFGLYGFELVDASEVNANPADPANWEGGVWTLPPVLSQGDEKRDEYLAIGESDRMTLLFRKRD